MTISPVDDDGVGKRYVEAVLDNAGGDENVVLMVHESQHDALQLGLGELSVTNNDAGLRHELADFRGKFVDGFDAVVDEVSLAAAFQFHLDGGAHELLVELGDDGLDGHPALGRGSVSVIFLKPMNRHMSRARNGRGGHRQDVDLRAHLLKTFFMANAEALLLVNHQQPEILELEVLGQHTMSSDEDVDLAGGSFLEDLFLLLR